MKVNQLSARALTPISYAIEGGGSACRNGPVLRNWTECHHTAHCTRIFALVGARRAYRHVTLRFALADFRIGDIYNALEVLQYFLGSLVSDKFETDGSTFDDRSGRTLQVPRLNNSGSSALFGFMLLSVPGFDISHLSSVFVFSASADRSVGIVSR